MFALIGVGKGFAGVYGIADSLLSGLATELATDALGIVDAVGRSSSETRGRPCGGSILRAWPR